MSEAASPSVPLPAPFGKYLLESLIAVGGMAEVYRARIFGASGFEKEMVVKRILPRYARSPAFIQMLIDEAKIAVSLTHGNIVPIYELGELDGSYYIAMEYVDGRTVLDVLRDAHARRVPLSWPQCASIGAEVCRGLAYAHDRTELATGRPLGLVHRDINPRNIVITRGGEVKILDFGIARASTKRHQTASGVIKGTPGYMSPEQMYGHSVDHRSDLYCVGVMLFELLTLRRLFPVWNVAEMRQVFEAGPIPAPSAVNPVLPAALDAIVLQALAPDVRDRWQCAADLEEALRTAIARAGVAVTASGLARELAAIAAAPEPAPDAALASSTEDEGTPRDGARPATPAAAPAPSATSGVTAASRPASRPAPLQGQGSTTASTPPPSQPPRSAVAPAAVDDDLGFVVSVVDDGPPVPLSPLPNTGVQADGGPPRTHVLAQNGALAWSQNIGDDAELLAIARAVGNAPGTGRRSLLLAAAVFAVVVTGTAALLGDELRAVADRAARGQAQTLGTIVIKVRPTPEEVVLDDRSRGAGNKKITNVDVDQPHRLVVRVPGQDAVVLELTRADFVPTTEGTPTFALERNLATTSTPPGPILPLTRTP